MPLNPTKWTTGDYIPRSGLVAWHAADTADTDGEVFDASGNDIHLATPVPTAAVLTPDTINGLPAMVFDGSAKPMISDAESITVRHAFVLAASDDATFPGTIDVDFYGLLTGLASGDILVGKGSTSLFYDFNHDAAGEYDFRKNDVSSPESNMPGSFNGQLAIFEVMSETGIALDGIMVGQQRTNEDRKWVGPWCEQILYSAVKDASERQQIYEYIAMKYFLWRQVASGLNVWPFQPDWPINSPVDKLVLTSITGSGTRKSRSKSTGKRGFELSFTDREPEEYLAAEGFWDQHYPGEAFIFRDESVIPSMDNEVQFTAPFGRQAGSHRSNAYAIQCLQV